MAKNNDRLLEKLLATFRVEADEHLKAMSAALGELARGAPRERKAALVEGMYREAHSLKGAARAVNRKDIETVCQALESAIAPMKEGKSAATARFLELLQHALDAIGAMRDAAGDAPQRTAAAVVPLIRQIEEESAGASRPRRNVAIAETRPDALSFEAEAPSVTPAAGAPARLSVPAMDTMRISTEKLDAVMRQAEELLSRRLAATQRANELREAGALLDAWAREGTRMLPAVRAMQRTQTPPAPAAQAARAQQALARLLDHLDAGRTFVQSLKDRFAGLQKSAERDRRVLAGVTESLLQQLREMHLLPVSSLLDNFPRVARELARDQSKRVEVTIAGGEIEVDRRILDELKDPLLHLLRNCVDHGIEAPATREQSGKPPHGRIAFCVTQQDGGKIELTVADDGAGIDVAKVAAAARRLGAIPPQGPEAAQEQEALALIFHSGVSTSPIITDVSGRGLGLAIAREKVERLRGSIGVESRRGAGTTFRIVLPLTLATYRGVLLRAGTRLFVVPATSVERIVRIECSGIRTVENRETISLGGHVVSLSRLDEVLELPRARATEAPAQRVQAIVLGAGAARIAFAVEEVLGEQEVLVKALGPQLARVRNVAGACVLGTGEIVPVLNPADLMLSATQAAGPLAAAEPETPQETGQRSILVVEDSITARALLKNILESAGYAVATAVDGIDAYTALKTATFDLVVSDVEMPRMDGFALTAKIRADRKLSELPVVLVTALGSREHRERGVDAGANAYIVKSDFEQSNLLEVVGRLI